jgi:hypothetical protein
MPPSPVRRMRFSTAFLVFRVFVVWGLAIFLNPREIRPDEKAGLAENRGEAGRAALHLIEAKETLREAILKELTVEALNTRDIMMHNISFYRRKK